jgi:hypothetical protein
MPEAAPASPVITTRISGSRTGRHGTDSLLLSDPADADELAEQMGVLLDESQRQEMGAAARQTALRHTLKRNVEEILAVYERSPAAAVVHSPRTTHRPDRTCRTIEGCVLHRLRWSSTRPCEPKLSSPENTGMTSAVG